MCSAPTRTWILQNDQHEINESKKEIFQLMADKRFCDLTIVCNDKKFPVHSVVMAANCKYFALNIKNNEYNYENEMTFNNINPDIMEKVIDFCYTGKIELSDYMLKDLMFAANTFQLSSLMNACCEFLKTLVDTDSCLLIEKLASTYSLPDLQETASECIRFNFNEIRFTQNFLGIEFQQLSKLLKYEDLNVTDENIVMDSVKRWVNHDPHDRKKYMFLLYELIKLPFLSIETLFSECDSLLKIDDCTRFVVEAIKWKTLENTRPQLESNRTKSRKPDTLILTVGCWDLDKAPFIEMYDYKTDTWSRFMDLKTSARNYSYALLNFDLLILGGFSGSIRLNTVTNYDLLNGQQKTLSPMQEAREHPGVGVIAGIVYVAGGHDGKQFLKTAEKYDPTTDKWSYIESMPTARTEVGCAVFDHELFIIGGHSGGTSLDVTEAYCPKSNQWRICSPMSTTRYSPGVAKLGKFIYAVGGRKAESSSNIQSAERYDPKFDIWSAIEALDTPRYGLGLAAMGNNLIAVGGGQGGGTMTIVEEYDTSTNKWKKLAPCISRAHVNLLAVSKKWTDKVKTP